LYEKAWLSENRPYWLRNVLARYDQSTQLWITRADRARSVQKQWLATHALPTAAEAGLPAELESAPTK
jgi:hypothetical protein